MISCSAPSFVRWHPDLSDSGVKERPEWTRLRCDGVELANSLESIDWTGERVQVIICDSCGWPHCASGAYVRISRLGSWILWTPPDVDLTDEFERSQYQPLRGLERRGAVVIHSSRWEEWRREHPSLPPPESFPCCRRIDLGRAWALEARAGLSIDDPGHMRRTLEAAVLASDELDSDAALGVVDRIVEWVHDAPEAEVHDSLVPPASVGGRVDTLYAGGPHDWPALGRLPTGYTIALGRDLLLTRALVPEQ